MVGVRLPPDDVARSERRSGFAAAIEADSAMAKKSVAAKKSAADLMAKYDRNCDGTFGVSEVVDIIDDLQVQTFATLKAQRQLKVYSILFVFVIACLGLVVGVNAAVTWMTVDSAKDTVTLRSLLTDRHGNIVAAKTAETTLPLIAAPVLEMATLATANHLVVTYALASTNSTVEKSLTVNDVSKHSDTWVEFELPCGEVCGKVVVKDGTAVYSDTNGNVYPVCAADVSCSAFTINEEAEVETLVAAAQLALGDSASASARRRLDGADGECTSTYTWVFEGVDEDGRPPNEQLRAAVASYLDDPATSKYGDISRWDTRHITDMSSLFSGNAARGFNADLSGWITAKVTNMQYMFRSARAFNGNVSGWDTSSVTRMDGMFERATEFDQDLTNWDTSSVERMSRMFLYARAFNGDVSGWDTSSVTTMRHMFQGATAFDGDISGWETGSVKDMSHMFHWATAFNVDISGWDTGEVWSMRFMFYGASSFNGNYIVSGWDTGRVRYMDYMFYGASSFNSDISGWDTGSVRKMRYMFYGASSFDIDISGWDTGDVTSMQVSAIAIKYVPRPPQPKHTRSPLPCITISGEAGVGCS